ncbi:hypothetical protein [Lysinibacillus sp. fls2-241-R2A-57]|nr:hypothetical protein [Lysinibacillus sp. fls2-241-R2A-57]
MFLLESVVYGSNRMLVTKALSKDVMLLAFIPLPASLALQGLICD